jgi:mono/diheme cytochrome c family protein
VARGAYLVEGLGHCGACHTPRAATFQEEALTPRDGQRFLAGSRFNGWFAPSLRGGDMAGLGRWTASDIEAFLMTGRTDKFAAFGEMSLVVHHSTQFMTAADRIAVAWFLRTLPPASAKRPSAGVELTVSQTYLDECAACHGADGNGSPSGFPALARNPIVNTNDPTSLIHIVLTGGAMPATHAAQTQLVMPPFGQVLSDKKIADTLTFVRSNWGNHASAISPAKVTALRRSIG